MHTAIIMDGNGRWAEQRGLPRLDGHRHGAAAVRRAIEAAPGCAISDLTLYAFSADNWKRPPDEVAGLMKLLAWRLENEVDGCLTNGVRLSVIGRRDRIGPDLRNLIQTAEARTRSCSRLHVRLAIDYSSRDALVGAARFCASWSGWSRSSFAEALPAPEVDLLIRTGGEQRLSDFLLWECAYAELVFLPVLWPDFDARDLAAAVSEFRSRDRRYGGLNPRSDALAVQP